MDLTEDERRAQRYVVRTCEGISARLVRAVKARDGDGAHRALVEMQAFAAAALDELFVCVDDKT